MANLQLVGGRWVDVDYSGLQLINGAWIEGAGQPFDPTLTGSGVIADEIKRALGAGHIQDLTATHFGKLAGESLQDAERRFLIANGATPGHLNDMWTELYGSAGKRHVRAAILAYWANQ